ncbi:hypothetical protein ONS95_006817 [Cadophora gregata]|uniref:uncharacterized protein n=1 Tax=Cadophora gregata TaxID=51156 RepID=UPI0026DBC054|nr:uncharacterized protein ONS95_006817 [Cadophora gregata]KAK0101657.1 hypothetical protein ONS95_006817 [Cadophora gregata]
MGLLHDRVTESFELGKLVADRPWDYEELVTHKIDDQIADNLGILLRPVTGWHATELKFLNHWTQILALLGSKLEEAIDAVDAENLTRGSLEDITEWDANSTAHRENGDEDQEEDEG